MKANHIRRFATAALALAIWNVPLLIQAQLRSKSGEIVVMEPSELPKAAQVGGNSLLLHATDSGSYYLYVEQGNGTRLAVFDVNDPADIKSVSTTPLTGSGPFDFVRPLDGKAELIQFRDGTGEAILDLAKAGQPHLRRISALTAAGHTQSLSETGLLAAKQRDPHLRAEPQDYQVLDISKPVNPVLLATVKQVTDQVANDETGTTFLLGSNGLTLVRRISAEADYAAHQQQMAGN